MRVAIVERELVAGECSYWACMPSKTLLRPGEAVAAAAHAPGSREAVGGSIDTAAALGWRNKVVSDWDDSGQVPWLEEKGIELIRGDARLTGPGAVEVDGQAHQTERIVIATGSDPMIPPIEGLEGLEGVWTNREVTGMKEVPGSIVILGGGPVGVEMGQACRRFGAEVTIVEADERLLAKEAPPVGETLAEALGEEGIELRLGAKAESAAARDRGYALGLGDDEVEAERLLVATGRKPRLDLNLGSVGIEPGGKGIEVDERLRAGDGVWAIGDVTGIMPFTHVGKYQARIAAKDILGEQARADYRAVPRVVFTDPQVAAVGEPEGEATGTAELTSLARTSTYARNGEARGFLTLVSDGTKLTGAYAVGPEAGDWLQQATLAIRAGVPLELLRDTIQPFPTFSEAFVSALAELD
jgi:pyruvate/2-oxoglutarate dehydrogenase complex dihydrolipoamide dehydrogenase (E3) component